MHSLVFTTDNEQGYSRRKCGRGFAYYDQRCALIREPETKNRINQLAIPPAYRDVWICPLDTGHLQATGFDDRNRKQYRYHPIWSQIRNEKKFERLLDFATSLPAIRKRVQADLAADDPVDEKQQVTAAAVRLIDHTGARIGNETYTQKNGTHGITTLEDHHVETESGDDLIRLDYTGKGGRDISFEINSPAISRVVNRCSELPGERLFCYEKPDKSIHTIRSQDVNDYLQSIADGITAKDFRTWKATLLCFSELANLPVPKEESKRTKLVNEALKTTASNLYHRPATCRKYYVHPAVIDSFMNGKELSGADHLRARRSPRYRHAEMEKALIKHLESRS